MLAFQVVLTIAGLSAVSAALTSSVYHRKNALTSLGSGSKNDLEPNNQENVRQTKDEAELSMEEYEDELGNVAAAAGSPIPNECATTGHRPPNREFNSSRSDDIVALCKMAVLTDEYAASAKGIICSCADLATCYAASDKLGAYTSEFSASLVGAAIEMPPISVASALATVNALGSKLTIHCAAWETSNVACDADKSCRDKANEAAITKIRDDTSAFITRMCP